jgi:hypothetical protein
MTDIYPGYWNRGRALHVIDLENLADGRPGWRRSREVWLTYERGIGVQNGDRAIVVVSSTFAAAVRSVIPSYVRLKFCPAGPDAADRMLQELAAAEMSRSKFAMVIIASGDHSFASTAELARSQGMNVWLVSGYGGVSRKLAALCPLRSRLRLPAQRSSAVRSAAGRPTAARSGPAPSAVAPAA